MTVPSAGGNGQHLVSGGDSESEQYRDAGERQDQPAPDEQPVMQAPGILLARRARIPVHGIKPETDHNQHDQCEKDEHAPPEQGSRSRRGPGRVEHRVRAAATGELQEDDRRPQRW
jgi:hypothetical protein